MQDKNETSVLDVMAAKPELAFAELMPRVVENFGKSLPGQIRDLLSYCMRGNKLSVHEYYLLCLFDDETYSAEDKKRFVGLQKSRAIWGTFMELNMFTGLVNDKLAFEKMLSGFGVPTTKTLAIAGGHYPEGSVCRLADESSLGDFLSNAVLPVFGKPVSSTQSLGSTRIDAYDVKSKEITLSNGKTISVAYFWNEIESKFSGDYIFQSCIEPHSFFQKMCGGGVPTMRVVTLETPRGVEIYRCVAKLTGDGNVADNFWRKGNLLATIDPETGKLGKALTAMGADAEFLSNHPSSDCLIEGETVPYWEQICKTALDAARLLPGAGILGFDVAVGADGPVLIEANNDPHLIMMQVAHRKGVLDGPMLEALEYAEARKGGIIASQRENLAREQAESKEEMKQATSAKAA